MGICNYYRSCIAIEMNYSVLHNNVSRFDSNRIRTKQSIMLK